MIFGQAEELWSKEQIRAAARDTHRHPHLHGFMYFMENIKALQRPEWVPSADDILHCRYRTSGFVEYKFDYQQSEWKIIDVGGEADERRKWIKAEGLGVDAIIFFACLDDFDVPSKDIEGWTRMQESLATWSEVVNGSDSFGEIPVILLLNKKDLLQEKLKHTSLDTAYPEFMVRSTRSSIFLSAGMVMSDLPSWLGILLCRAIAITRYRSNLSATCTCQQ
jgi:hypothetical protein